MSRRVLRVGALAMLGLGLAAGCGSAERPRELSLSTVQPCQLISSTELNQLHVPHGPQPLDSVPGVGLEGSSCLYRVRPGNTVVVSAITNHGIAWWMDGPSEHARFTDVAPVQGYRTIKVWYTYDRPSPDHTCRLYVAVADGQALRVRVGESVDDEDPPTCHTARQFAEAAMDTLVSSN